MRDLHTNHKKPSIILIVMALAVLTGGTAGILSAIGRDKGDSKQQLAASQTESKVQPATAIRFTAEADKTVLEQLKNTAEDVVVKGSQYGAYVDSIGGLSGGTDNKYWTYYVDGQMANIGAGEYTTTGGEEIVWKFE